MSGHTVIAVVEFALAVVLIVATIVYEFQDGRKWTKMFTQFRNDRKVKKI